jgi:hypothetical protein
MTGDMDFATYCREIERLNGGTPLPVQYMLECYGNSMTPLAASVHYWTEITPKKVQDEHAKR